MGMQIRDDRQMKALTGLSQAHFDHLLPVFSAIYQAAQQKTYEDGVESGTRTRKPVCFARKVGSWPEFVKPRRFGIIAEASVSPSLGWHPSLIQEGPRCC
jgi:hypothetical protein